MTWLEEAPTPSRRSSSSRTLGAQLGGQFGEELHASPEELKPLGRQAEVARKAQVVQADLRDAKARLLVDDLVASPISGRRPERAGFHER